MKLKVKKIGLSSGGPLIVVLNNFDAGQYGLSALDRVRITYQKKEVVAVINISAKNNIKADK